MRGRYGNYRIVGADEDLCSTEQSLSHGSRKLDSIAKHFIGWPAMDYDHEQVQPQTSPASGEKWARRKSAGIMAVAIIGFYLLSRHSGIVPNVALYLVLLACPLMHVFIHRRHAGHNTRHGRDPAGSGETACERRP